MRTSLPKCNQIKSSAMKRKIATPSENDKLVSLKQEWRPLFENQLKRNNSLANDWYQFPIEHLDEQATKVLNEQFNGSIYKTLSTIFPENEWQPWKFNTETVPRGFWTAQSNQRKFFDDLGRKIGVHTLDDWYGKLSLNMVLENGGRGVLTYYKAKPIIALMAAYPEHNWVPWKFNMVPQGYWKDVENLKKFFDWLGKKLGVQTLDDWYQKLSFNVITENGGHGMLDRYKASPIAALMTAYPEHNWIIWKFNNVSSGFWKDKTNHKKFFDYLGQQIGIKTLDDWYEKLSCDIITEHGGGRLLAIFKYSPTALLMSVYPEHKWIPWNFKSLSHQCWKSKENVSQFVAHLAEKLSIQTLDDWYRVDLNQLRQFGASSLIFRYKGLYQVLKEQYPHHLWDRRKFQQKGGKKGQRWLAVTLKKMFPNEEILEDYNHPKVMLPSSKRPLQLDVFIPSKNLAFEYQGQQHYEDVSVFSPTKTYQQRDEEKRTLCASNNIKLIEVPYWWNRTQQSLQEIINQ